MPSVRLRLVQRYAWKPNSHRRGGKGGTGNGGRRGFSNLPACLQNSRYTEEAEICDHHFPVVVEYIFRFEIFMEDSLRVQVAHSLLKQGNRVKKLQRDCWAISKQFLELYTVHMFPTPRKKLRLFGIHFRCWLI